MGRKSTTGGATPLGEHRIQLYFRFQGQKCRPTLERAPTEPNLRAARRYVEDIERRIRLGTFDLAKEFPAYKGLARFVPEARAAVPKIFRQYGATWLGTKGKLSPSTIAGYEKVLKAHWYRWFGDKVISTIVPSELEERMGTLPGGRKTHNNVFDVGRQVFELALRDGAIAANPCAGVSFLELQRPLPDPYDLGEVALILPKLRERWGEEMHDYYEAAFFSGLRPSEQIEQRWDLDIDLRAGLTQVQRARVKGKVKDVKNYDRRVIEHHSRYQAALERQYARTGLAGGYVWLSPFSGHGRKRGEPWLDEKRQGEMFRSVVRVLRMRPRPAKNTRHTYATILLMSDCKVSWCAGQMGHSVAMFEQRYAKWIQGADRGVELAKAERFTGQFAGQSGSGRRSGTV
jgi:integrase